MDWETIFDLFCFIASIPCDVTQQLVENSDI